MAKILQHATVTCEATFVVSEAELRALDALVGYGDDAFIAVFYEKLGKAYMQPHEDGLRELFKSMRAITPGILQRIDDARKIFYETSEAWHSRLNPPKPHRVEVPD